MLAPNPSDPHCIKYMFFRDSYRVKSDIATTHHIPTIIQQNDPHTCPMANKIPAIFQDK